jgi:hypothetical protein
MESHEFYELVSDFLGPKASQVGYDRAGREYTCTLYESFAFMCGLVGDHGEFGAGIESPSGGYFTNFLGRRLSLNSDRESILESLRIVDEWCRLRLPDKFLERYEAARGIDAS